MLLTNRQVQFCVALKHLLRSAVAVNVRLRMAERKDSAHLKSGEGCSGGCERSRRGDMVDDRRSKQTAGFASNQVDDGEAACLAARDFLRFSTAFTASPVVLPLAIR
jgi:hypothetical protein